jgi:hypothetical protein
MEKMYGATKGPRRYSRVFGAIELDDFIQEFDSWCDIQQIHNPQLFTPFMAWKGLANGSQNASGNGAIGKC